MTEQRKWGYRKDIIIKQRFGFRRIHSRHGGIASEVVVRDEHGTWMTMGERLAKAFEIPIELTEIHGISIGPWSIKPKTGYHNPHWHIDPASVYGASRWGSRWGDSERKQHVPWSGSEWPAHEPVPSLVLPVVQDALSPAEVKKLQAEETEAILGKKEPWRRFQRSSSSTSASTVEVTGNPFSSSNTWKDQISGSRSHGPRFQHGPWTNGTRRSASDALSRKRRGQL